MAEFMRPWACALPWSSTCYIHVALFVETFTLLAVLNDKYICSELFIVLLGDFFNRRERERKL